MNCAPSRDILSSDRRKPGKLPFSVGKAWLCAACLIFGPAVAACTASESGHDPESVPHNAEPRPRSPLPTTTAASPEHEKSGEQKDGASESAGAADAGGGLPPQQSLPPRRLPVDEPRVYAKTRNVWIRGKPTTDTQWIGFLWWGDSLPLRSPEPVAGPGCSTFYAVQPRGYVCVDGKKATLDPNDPVVRGTFPYAHDASRPNPHAQYGETRGAYRYLELPSERTQRAREWDYRFRMGWIENARAGRPRHEQLQGVDLTQATSTSLALPELPSNLRMPHRKLVPRSTVAWSAEVLHEGRTFLLTDDLAWVPKDNVIPYPKIDYQGVHLGGDVRLPLALIRKRDCKAYAISADDAVTETGSTYPRLGWVPLNGEKRKIGRRTFWQTKRGDWLAEDEAVIPQPRDKTPWGAPLYEPDTTGKQPKGRQTWIQISILGGWLVAFEGTEPVFATLMSPGSGGPPHGDRELLETASTPTGWFKITGKFVTSTMIAPNDLVHSAVPWAQNFSGPYAIHGAYWHNDWGQPKSGGCINLSPLDAKWMYEFTEPKAPEGWHGVRWLPSLEPSTALIIGR